MGIFGLNNHQVRSLYKKAESKTSDFDKLSRKKRRSNEEKGIGSMHQLLQNPYPVNVEESLLGSRIDYLSEFGKDDKREEGVNKDLSWCSGIVERLCYGT